MILSSPNRSYKLKLKKKSAIKTISSFQLIFAEQFSIGRSSANDVVISDPGISRFHAQILVVFQSRIRF